jgi:hypothetical protein
MERADSISIRHDETTNTWRLYWGGTEELADSREFRSLDEAAPVARALMTLRLVKPPKD